MTNQTTDDTILETRLASLAGQQIRLQQQVADGHLRGHEYMALLTPITKRIREIDPVGNTYPNIYQKVRAKIWVQNP
jgi:hypothetical protein